MTQDRDAITDETLTAYLDGELETSEMHKVKAALADDEGLAARLAALDLPIDNLRRIMAPEVLRAPDMPASLRAAVAAPAPSAAPKRRWSIPPLALVASFLLGMVATTLLLPAPDDTPPPLGWTAAVASYQSLYVTETLTSTQATGDTDAVLTRAAQEFDVALGPATQIDGLTFKRAQMLGFRGKPLLQIAYLTPDGTPLALCLIATDKPDRGAKDVSMFDLAGVSWVENGVGYFLIGGDDPAQVQRLSESVIAAL